VSLHNSAVPGFAGAVIRDMFYLLIAGYLSCQTNPLSSYNGFYTIHIQYTPYIQKDRVAVVAVLAGEIDFMR
jgi:hypothetical protein